MFNAHVSGHDYLIEAELHFGRYPCLCLMGAWYEDEGNKIDELDEDEIEEILRQAGPAIGLTDDELGVNDAE